MPLSVQKRIVLGDEPVYTKDVPKRVILEDEPEAVYTEAEANAILGAEREVNEEEEAELRAAVLEYLNGKPTSEAEIRRLIQATRDALAAEELEKSKAIAEQEKRTEAELAQVLETVSVDDLKRANANNKRFWTSMAAVYQKYSNIEDDDDSEDEDYRPSDDEWESGDETEFEVEKTAATAAEDDVGDAAELEGEDLTTDEAAEIVSDQLEAGEAIQATLERMKSREKALVIFPNILFGELSKKASWRYLVDLLGDFVATQTSWKLAEAKLVRTDRDDETFDLGIESVFRIDEGKARSVNISPVKARLSVVMADLAEGGRCCILYTRLHKFWPRPTLVEKYDHLKQLIRKRLVKNTPPNDPEWSKIRRLAADFQEPRFYEDLCNDIPDLVVELPQTQQTALALVRNPKTSTALLLQLEEDAKNDELIDFLVQHVPPVSPFCDTDFFIRLRFEPLSSVRLYENKPPTDSVVLNPSVLSDDNVDSLAAQQNAWASSSARENLVRRGYFEYVPAEGPVVLQKQEALLWWQNHPQRTLQFLLHHGHDSYFTQVVNSIDPDLEAERNGQTLRLGDLQEFQTHRYMPPNSVRVFDAVLPDSVLVRDPGRAHLLELVKCQKLAVPRFFEPQLASVARKVNDVYVF